MKMMACVQVIVEKEKYAKVGVHRVPNGMNAMVNERIKTEHGD